MPIAMPAAPYASAATSPRPSKKPPAAITGMSTASTTCGSSSVVGTGPVWPPPSPPCTITASAPHAATFSAWRRAPIDGTTAMPASFSVLIWCSRGASANDATAHVLADEQVDARVGVLARRRAGSRRTAGRCAPSPRGSRPRAGRGHRRRREDAERARVRGRRRRAARRATQPMPVCTIGHVDAERDRRAACAGSASRVRALPARRGRCGSITSRISAARRRSAAASRARRRRSRARSRSRRRRRRRSRPGCTERSRIAVVGRLEVEHAEVRDDAHELVEARRARAELGGAVVADAAHDVDRRARTPASSGSGSSTTCVSLIVLPGRAAHAEQLRASGFACDADEREVLVAERSIWLAPIITWRRPDHTTSNIERYGFQPRDDLLRRRRRRPAGCSRRAAPRRRSSRARARTSPWRGGRRSSAACRSGWRGSRRRRGSTRRARPRTPRRGSAHRTSRRVTRATALLVLGFGHVEVLGAELVPRLVALRARRRTAVWNASSRP